MKNRFINAIRDTGSLARVPGIDGGEFPASIQPIGESGDGHGKTGLGQIRRYKMYAVCDNITGALRPGDELEYLKNRYVVESIKTLTFQDKDVFRQAILAEVEEGEA